MTRNRKAEGDAFLRKLKASLAANSPAGRLKRARAELFAAHPDRGGDPALAAQAVENYKAAKASVAEDKAAIEEARRRREARSRAAKEAWARRKGAG